MKPLILIILFLFAALTVTFSQEVEHKHAAPAAQSQSTYTCPMHPEIHSPIPGNCPKCGMKLIPEKKPTPSTSVKNKKLNTKKTTNRNHGDSTYYTCPMHPEIHSGKPGNCPKCGMSLVKVKSNSDASPIAPIKEEMKMTGDSTHHRENKTEKMKEDGHSNHNSNDGIAPKSLQIKTIENNTPPRTVRYDLYIRDTIVNFGKKSKRAIAVNGQIPMPTLIFTEGDTAEIYVHNELKEETSLHWHGLFLPNQMDGVPYLTQMPIKPHATYLYKFPIVQHGTHWYHSHTKLQEQIGMYGAFIMNKRNEWDIPTIPLVLSEWTDMKPEEVHRSLKSATDWFAIKKGTTQSYSEAISSKHFGTKVSNEWKRMNAMDVSDVYYDNFLINGKNQSDYSQLKSGDKVRLRIANAGASDYFWLTYSGGKITVVASDGNDVEPVAVDRMIIAVSETYDVIVTIPDNNQYEFLVTPEDRTSSASLWLGSGKKVPAEKLPKLKYFAGMKMMNAMMDMNGDMMEMEGMKMQNQEMDMNNVMYPEVTGYDSTGMKKNNPAPMNHSMHDMNMQNDNQDLITLNYNLLKSTIKSSLPAGPVRELKFDLTGNMNRYVWSLDNKVVSESDKILIKKGEIVRIILFNNSMMRHPMHLHGHDFRLLNGQGNYAPLKNIIDIMPMERDTIEFYANEPGGDWFFHCHILYHMMSGMGRVLSYENLPAQTDIPNQKVAKRGLNSDDRRFHAMGRLGIESNGSDGEFMLAQTRWKASTIWHLGYHPEHGYESETMFGRYLGKMQWWYPYIGFDYHYKKEGIPTEKLFNFEKSPKNIFSNEAKTMFGQSSNKNNRQTAIAGISYTLPMLVIADARIDGDGKFRFQLSREDVPVSKRLRLNLMINTDKEYMTGFRYIFTKYISLSTHYDSDMGLGVGITFTY